MEFFKTKTKINFMQQRKMAAVFSAIIFIASIMAILTQGLTLGLDFTGGTQIEVIYPKAIDANTVREGLDKAGFDKATVQAYSTHELSVRIGPYEKLSQEQLKNKLIQAIPGAKIGKLEYIGPQVSDALMTNGILAIVVGLLATMGYIALRFEYRFAISAALALIHDPVLILGVFAFFHLEFNMIGLTAVLTVIGYSLNDTIVVYDRVRENFRKIRKGTPTEIMDLSINETLSRTIMTSGLTLLVVIALFVYGGQTVHEFSLALMIGIFIGTYSSIYVAGSLAIGLGLIRANLLPAPKVPQDEMP